MRALIWASNENISALLWLMRSDPGIKWAVKKRDSWTWCIFLFEFLWDIVIFLQAHSHVKNLLSNAPVESVVRVTGIVSPRPPGQENPVRMLATLRGFVAWGKEHWTTELWWILCHSFATVSGCVTAYPQITWGEITAMTCNLGELQSTLQILTNSVSALWKNNG